MNSLAEYDQVGQMSGLGAAKKKKKDKDPALGVDETREERAARKARTKNERRNAYIAMGVILVGAVGYTVLQKIRAARKGTKK